jgi:hypothetical protein
VLCRVIRGARYPGLCARDRENAAFILRDAVKARNRDDPRGGGGGGGGGRLLMDVEVELATTLHHVILLSQKHIQLNDSQCGPRTTVVTNPTPGRE